MLRIPRTTAPGEVGVVGEVSIPLADEMAGQKFMLKFGRNSWPFWVFGRAVPAKPAQILETSSFEDAIAALAKGGKVLYTGPTAKSVKSRFKPVYWSAGHFTQADADLSSLGYMVDSRHPALNGIPTDDWADWLWYHLVEGGMKHGLQDLSEDYEPIVQPVPDLHYSTFMGMLFELRVGAGRLMVCGLNLSDQSKPEVRAVRSSILSYMESERFDPTTSIGMERFKEFFAPLEVSMKWRPSEFADAPVYIAAAVELNIFEKNIPWKPSFDMAEIRHGGYKLCGKEPWGVWRDSTGAFWHGRGLSVTLTEVNPVNGTLLVRFRDTNRKRRTGRGVCEGRPFTIPRHQDAKDCAYWAKLPVMREDFLDGKIEFSCDTLTGPNLMIDRVVLMED